jgi:hypothetical protein
MQLQNLLRPLTAAIATALLYTAAAQAAPITMSPDPVTLPGLRGTFTLSLTSGDTSNNTLVFGITGSNPSGPLPAAGIATLIFSGANIVSATELSDPDGMVSGIGLPGSGTLVGLLIDFGVPSQAAIRVRLSSTPTTATVTMVQSTFGLKKTTLTFTAHNPPSSGGGAAIPEPSAALCFAAGLALVGRRLRRP